MNEIDVAQLEEMNTTLSYLSSALETLGLAISSITDEREVILPKWAYIRINGYGSTLQCLSKMTLELSNEAEAWQNMANKPTAVHMPPKATLCGSDLAGKMAILEMSLGYMLNTHKDFHPAHSEYLGAFELCCEIRKQLDGGAL